MDIKKVIEILNDTEADMEYTNQEINTAYRIAIELLERQTPKKPKIYYAEGDNRIVCPNLECNGGEGINVYNGENYCTECGQKLDWN